MRSNGLLYKIDKNSQRAEQAEHHRTHAYRSYLEKKRQEVASKYERNQQIMSDMYPSASECISEKMRKQNYRIRLNFYKILLITLKQRSLKKN